MTVLPCLRIDSCEAQIALFQNRWFSDHECRIPQVGVTVTTGGMTYDMKMLKAMRSWHTTMTHYEGIENAIKWIKNHDDVVFTIPADILRFPHFDPHSIKAQHVWKEMEDTATVMNLIGETSVENATESRKRLIFVAVINVDLNHWCAVAVDYKEYTVNIYDPQQTGGRYEALRTFLSSELIPLLPRPRSPKRLRFKQMETTPQLDNYNCGVFVLLFFGRLLSGLEPTALEGSIRPAMQFSWYRILSHILTSM
ncbi:hypothetical protein PHMEG_00039617 [Phytophthora megakarya]|uniref:Ubiquitin-like protease family profile domain-containing protein n=1 Tax=Phytophthora megakarya TaxID=4795 RepID=A0A225UFI7_9STRA|nr:hypothetical protein PHMEG_00039617 [Phytophthora megakarya]